MKLKYTYAIQEVAHTFVAMAITDDLSEQNKLLHLNETGKVMIELLQKETSEDEIVKKLQEMYEGEEDQIRFSVKSFIHKLSEKGLID